MATYSELAWHLWDALVVDNFRSKGPFFTRDQYPDLSGQTWVVTGATGGIGLALAKILVEQNATLWIVGRNEEKLEAALQTLRGLRPLAKVDALTIDYSDLATVKPGVQRLLQSTPRLDGIIHNAGVLSQANDATTKQGYEQHIGVNNLATQLLQDLLDPLIEATPGGRIVYVSSLASSLAPLHGFDFARAQTLSVVRQYGESKALNYIQAVQWTRKHPQSNVKALAVHPGVIKSDLGRSMGSWLQSVSSFMQYDVEWGTYAPLYAALSPDVANNEYVVHWGRAGSIRPDIYRAAHGERGEEADAWIERQIAPFK